MDRRKFLLNGLSAGLIAVTGNFNNLANLAGSSQNQRVKTLANNSRFALRAHSTEFKRGDFVVIEVEPKEPLEDSTLSYDIITNTGTKRKFILPKLERNGKIFALAGIDVDYPKQVTNLEVELIAKGRNIGNKDPFNIPILDKKFRTDYFNSSNIAHASPKSLEDIKSQQREVRILYPSWSGITFPSHITDGFVPPRLECDLNSFGARRFYDNVEKSSHKGTDCSGNLGDLIVAPISGVVKLVEKNFFYTGNTIVIDHGLGLYTLYAHMSDQLVDQGQYVKIGAPIGKVGQTGRVSDAHLHWQAKLYGGIKPAMNMNPISLEILNQVFK